jgi:D-sedoheptulose 7-phosphate isomerase
MTRPMDKDQAIKCVVLDIDGVLTDGTTPVSGTDDKRLRFRDLDAIETLRREGLDIGFLTGEPEQSAGAVVERCGGGAAVYGAKNKRDGLVELLQQMNVEPDTVCYVADSDRDAPAMKDVGLALAPADASGDVRRAADLVLSTPGGEGVVAEVAEIVLSDGLTRASVLADVEHVEREIQSGREVLGAFGSTMAEPIAQLAQFLWRRLRRGATLFLFGNGGSAVMSQHAAAELVGRFRRERNPLEAVCLNADTAVLTSLANDYGYEAVFSRQLRGLGRAGDVAFAMSTSGTSNNVVHALKTGHDMGLHTVLLTGDREHVDEHVDWCLKVPSQDTARIQELHLLTWHVICDLLEQRMAPSGSARPSDTDR